MAGGAGARAALDALAAIGGGSSGDTDSDARTAAMTLIYARVAWVREQLFTVDLGDATRSQQMAALLRRYAASHASELPAHATNIAFCCECRRVASTHVSASMPAADRREAGAFNELGVNATMVFVDAATGAHELRCSKRSSAALRTAMGFEAKMTERCVECEPVVAEAVREALSVRVGHGVESGVAARLRRDARSALEQRQSAVPCGAAAMLLVNVIGRAVRLGGGWYAMCSICASLMRLQPHSRYGDALCCLHCDPKMLLKESELSNAPGAVASTSRNRERKLCRYCGSKLQRTRTTHHAHSTHAAALSCAQRPTPKSRACDGGHCTRHWTWRGRMRRYPNRFGASTSARRTGARGCRTHCMHWKQRAFWRT